MEALFITIGIIMNGLQLKNEIGNYSYLCSQKSSPNENPLWVSTKVLCQNLWDLIVGDIE